MAPWQPYKIIILLKGGDRLEEYELVYGFDSLYQAHKKARRGKQGQREVIWYECLLTENLERLSWHLAYDNATCRTGKGTHFAMNRLCGFLRDFYRKHGNDGYILKCDIRKYFNSIDHRVLKEKLSWTKL